MAQVLQYGCTKRGQRTLLFEGHEYWRKRENIVGQIIWRCSKFQSTKCPATVKTAGDRIITRPSEHNHEGNIQTIMAKAAVQEMKTHMSNVMATPSASQAAVTVNLTDAVKMALPDKTVIARSLRRYRQACQRTGPDVLPPPPSSVQFDMPARYMDFLVSDVGRDSEDRIVILGDRNLINGLERSAVWLADGTFKKCPSLFFQLYTIHFELSAGINPTALYCLLPDKSSATYTRLLQEVKSIIPNATPEVILTDFERSAMNAFRDAYPSSQVTGCYFHLCQSVLRKVSELGMRPAYDNNDELRGVVRCLPALAFVPLDEVVESFYELAASMPDEPGLDELTTYFEQTYVRGRRLPGRRENFRAAQFAPELWNKRDNALDGIARTTNIVEGWHNSLQSLFLCNHPSMWLFLDGLKKECSVQTASFLQGVAGGHRRPKAVYSQLKDRVQRAVTNYGRSDRLTFVRAMAHLSW